MSKQHLLLSLMAIVLTFAACKGSKKTTGEATATDQMEEKAAGTVEPMDLMIKKGACFGRCPIFEMDIAADGSIEYRGKRFVERTGVWKGRLSSEQLTEVQQLVASADIYQYEDQYRSGASDFPTHVLQVTKDGKSKSVAGDFALPVPIKSIIAHIDSIGHAAELKQHEVQVPRDAIPGEILAKLSKGEPQQIVDDFQDYGIKLKKRIAPNLPLYVFTFIDEDVSAGRLLILFREHANVEMAQFNQKVEERDK